MKLCKPKMREFFTRMAKKFRPRHHHRSMGWTKRQRKSPHWTSPAQEDWFHRCALQASWIISQREFGPVDDILANLGDRVIYKRKKGSGSRMFPFLLTWRAIHNR